MVHERGNERGRETHQKGQGRLRLPEEVAPRLRTEGRQEPGWPRVKSYSGRGVWIPGIGTALWKARRQQLVPCPESGRGFSEDCNMDERLKKKKNQYPNRAHSCLSGIGNKR